MGEAGRKFSPEEGALVLARRPSREDLAPAANLPDEEDCVNHEAGNDERKEDDAQNHQDHIATVGDDPTNVQENGYRHQAGAQRDEESDFPGASGHEDILSITLITCEST